MGCLIDIFVIVLSAVCYIWPIFIGFIVLIAGGYALAYIYNRPWAKIPFKQGNPLLFIGLCCLGVFPLWYSLTDDYLISLQTEREALLVKEAELKYFENGGKLPCRGVHNEIERTVRVESLKREIIDYKGKIDKIRYMHLTWSVTGGALIAVGAVGCIVTFRAYYRRKRTEEETDETCDVKES